MEKQELPDRSGASKPPTEFITLLESEDSPFADGTHYVVQLGSEFELPEESEATEGEQPSDVDNGLKKAA